MWLNMYNALFKFITACLGSMTFINDIVFSLIFHSVNSKKFHMLDSAVVMSQGLQSIVIFSHEVFKIKKLAMKNSI